MLCSSLPFDHEKKSETIRMTIEDKLLFELPVWKKYTPQCIDLLSRLLIKEPDERITISQMLKHPWFS